MYLKGTTQYSIKNVNNLAKIETKIRAKRITYRNSLYNFSLFVFYFNKAVFMKYIFSHLTTSR